MQYTFPSTKTDILDGPLSSLQTRIGLVTDIVIENKEEYLIMSDGNKIRLDHIFQLKIVDL